MVCFDDLFGLSCRGSKLVILTNHAVNHFKIVMMERNQVMLLQNLFKWWDTMDQIY